MMMLTHLLQNVLNHFIQDIKLVKKEGWETMILSVIMLI